MADFLVFRRMIAPVVIQIMFWLGFIGIVAVGIITIVTSRDVSYWGYEGSELGVVGGVLMLFIGPIVWRIYCEIIILFFRMNEALTDISNKLDRNS